MGKGRIIVLSPRGSQTGQIQRVVRGSERNYPLMFIKKLKLINKFLLEGLTSENKQEIFVFDNKQKKSFAKPFLTVITSGK